jgi:integrase/recombinase XerC
MTTFFMPIPDIEIIQSFIDYLRFEKRYSVHTVKAYADDLNQFHSYCILHYELESLLTVTTTIVRSWMASLSEKKLNPRSINRKLSSIRSFYDYGRRTGIFKKNPATSIQVLKTAKRLPSYIEEGLMNDLFEHVEFPDNWSGYTEQLVLVILYQTGIRVSELVGIRENHINQSLHSLKVLGKGNKERIIPVSSMLLGKVVDYNRRKALFPERESEGYLLENEKGRKLNTRFVYSIVRKYLSLVTTAEKKSPHVLRHSFATHLTDHGADLNAVKELLGHSSLAATQVYTHNSIEKLRNIHKKAHPKG